MRATDENQKLFERKRPQIEQLNERLAHSALIIKSAINGNRLYIIKQANSSGRLYGSVKSKDVAENLRGLGFDITNDNVEISDRIDTVGSYNARVALFADVYATVDLIVAPNEQEAKKISDRMDGGFVMGEDDWRDAIRHIFREESAHLATDQKLNDTVNEIERLRKDFDDRDKRAHFKMNILDGKVTALLTHFGL